MTMQEANQLEYAIDQAYKCADRFQPNSGLWHYWMDKAKELTNKLHGRKDK